MTARSASPGSRAVPPRKLAWSTSAAPDRCKAPYTSENRSRRTTRPSPRKLCGWRNWAIPGGCHRWNTSSADHPSKDGSAPRSTSTTSCPPRPNARAAADPAMPAPITITRTVSACRRSPPLISRTANVPGDLVAAAPGYATTRPPRPGSTRPPPPPPPTTTRSTTRTHARYGCGCPPTVATGACSACNCSACAHRGGQARRHRRGGAVRLEVKVTAPVEVPRP